MPLTRFGLIPIFAVLCLAQNSTTIDDTDPSVIYAGQWTHDNVGSDYLYQGSQSWTNDPAATVAFSFAGTGFDLCGGLKADRGTFSWTVDRNVASGTGSEAGPSMTEGPCAVVASIRNLEAGNHQVVIANTGGQYLAIDSFTFYTDDSASSTIVSSSASTSSTPMRGRPTLSLSMSRLSSSTSPASSMGGKAVVSNATNRTAKEEEDQQVSTGHKAAMIGGSIAGGILAAILIALSCWLWKRRRSSSDDDDLLYPDKFSPSAEEKTFPWSEKRPLSTAAGPAGGTPTSYSHSHSHSLPRSQGITNLHKRQISRQDSLESFTEAFQPETLRVQPQIQPYQIDQFAPALQGSEVRNVANPFDVAPLRTKSSYEGRLAAASASLPDFHQLPIPRRNPPTDGAARARSEVSSAYPATERGVSHVETRHSAAYSGIEMEGDEDDREGWRTFEAYQNSPIGFGGQP